MIDFQKLVLEPGLAAYLHDCHIGLEKESQRVDRKGRLSQKPHPEKLGNRSFHPYLQTDFAETQLEAITPVCDEESEALAYLHALHDVLWRSLDDDDERIYPTSMPPDLPEEEAAIRLAELDNPQDVAYRAHLAKVYGKRRQMVSGIHYNIELGADLLNWLYERSGTELSYWDFKNVAYFKIARQYVRYQWLMSYLFGASPLANRGYPAEGLREPVRSIRNSVYGYRNAPDIEVSLESLSAHVSDLEGLVASGRLSEMKEFYSPIRLRSGGRMEDLGEQGVRYVELRNFDLNPFESIGIDEQTCRFVHDWLLFLLFYEEQGDYRLGYALNDAVALENPEAETAYLEEGLSLFEVFNGFLDLFELPHYKAFEERLRNPKKTLAARMLGDFDVMEYADSYHQKAWAKYYQLAGFGDMELSTQNLMFDALQKGVQVEVLDRQNQMLALRLAGHEEIVKNGNMTAHDALITSEIVENKTVTKKILARAGFQVPAGAEFNELEKAQAAYGKFAGTAIVIKPKSTNYGLGISIFKAGASREQYEKALAIAFSYDEEVLVEGFAEGTEYRFFVIDGETKAVLRRDSANVLGDGQKSIRELVIDKNASPLRGEPYECPLEKIQLGEVESLMLDSQGLSWESIPGAGERVNLRENSNISTGGDSIDMTEQMAESYKRLAEAAAKALGAKITGLDLMIPDLSDDDGAYTIIEANLNPMMSMHLYPFKGKERRVTMNVLAYLFPELKL